MLMIRRYTMLIKMTFRAPSHVAIYFSNNWAPYAFYVWQARMHDGRHSSFVVS